MHLVHIWSVVESTRRSSRENESSLLIEEYSIDNRRSSVEVLIEIINYTINSSISIPRTCLVRYCNCLRYRLAPITQIKSECWFSDRFWGNLNRSEMWSQRNMPISQEWHLLHRNCGSYVNLIFNHLLLIAQLSRICPILISTTEFSIWYGRRGMRRWRRRGRA